jgi:hypothetical protein
MLGLKGDSAGLIQSATSALGLSRAANSGTATGLWTALDDKDYTYAASGDSKETEALTQYETWMKAVLLAEAKRSTCWKLNGTNSGAHQDSDKYTWCVAKAAGVNQGGATGEKFHPLMQVAATANTWAHSNAAATAARNNFGDGTSNSNDKHIYTAGANQEFARAHSNLWFMAWTLDALNHAWYGVKDTDTTWDQSNAVGDTTKKASNTKAGTWAATDIGMAEATQTNKQGLAAAANQ